MLGNKSQDYILDYMWEQRVGEGQRTLQVSTLDACANGDAPEEGGA